MQRLLVDELGRRPSAEIAILGTRLGLKRDFTLETLAKKLLRSGNMMLDCDANRGWDLAMLQKADTDTCFRIKTKDGLCWDPANLAAHILANGNIITDSQFRHMDENSIRNVFRGARDYLLTDDELKELYSAIDPEVATQIKELLAGDITKIPDEFMELTLKTGQIMQNVGPYWDAVLDGGDADFSEVFWGDEANRTRLRDQWNGIKHKTSIYEPPEEVGLYKNAGKETVKPEYIAFQDLAFAIINTKATAYEKWYDQYSALETSGRNAFFKLQPNMSSKDFDECKSGAQCSKIVSTKLLDAYNAWVEGTGKGERYDYKAKLDEINAIRHVVNRNDTVVTPTIANPAAVVPSISRQNVVENARAVLQRYSHGIRNFRHEDLSGADLSGANFSGANFSGANLSGANFSGANLSGANLLRANLLRADLRDADLRRVNLFEANLRDADLRDADLRRVNLDGAELTGTIINTGTHGVILQQLRDRGAYFY